MSRISTALLMPAVVAGLVLGAAPALVPPAAAAEPSAADGQRPGRYTMTPADGGFVRLDTETGAMALCAKRSEGWVCEAMPDAQDAQRRAIDKLEAENRALKDEIRRMEEVLGLGDAKPGENGPRQAERPKGGLGLPSEQDVDKAFDYVQRMLKKFQERMRELESGQAPGGKGGTPL